MIRLTSGIDLGRDHARMTKRDDVLRQKKTVEKLLWRFFTANPKDRREVQILADEVGMGKTYVALAAACAILHAMAKGDAPEDLQGCYQRVLILAPSRTLMEKWFNEVGEFLRRCADESTREELRWFTPIMIDRIDELPRQLSQSGGAPRLLIAPLDFAGGKIKHYEVKRRVILAALFRHWGIAFATEKRERLLKGAPDGWPARAGALLNFDESEKQRLTSDTDEVYQAIKELSAGRGETAKASQDLIAELHARCLEAAEPYNRDRVALFNKISLKLIDLYRLALDRLILRAIPLVIVDEAHNWKNGPEAGTNGWNEFSRLIARRTRRLLMLTATPFQLRPDEMLNILQTGDQLEPCPPSSDPAARTDKLQSLRELTLRPVLRAAEMESKDFAKLWRRLPPGTDTASLRTIWMNNADVIELRSRLHALAELPGHLPSEQLDQAMEGMLKSIDPILRPFISASLRLFARNLDLSLELGTLVIRHRRGTEHRLFRVGEEFSRPAAEVAARQDRKLLHSAPGMDVRGDGELPHYLLMRCVSGMKRAQGKSGVSSLGSNLTGCYSTLFKSAEGGLLTRLGGADGETAEYLNLLKSLVNENSDPSHPKLKPVVDDVVNAWIRGEKTLIFCFRVNTAERLQEIISARVEEEMDRRETEVLGDANQLKNLRNRLSGKEQDLSPLTFDRVLYSRWIADGRMAPLDEADFQLAAEDAEPLARLALARGVDLTLTRPDRVFIHRATEHLLASRWLKRRDLPKSWRTMLETMAREDWIDFPYGTSLDGRSKADEEAGIQLQIDESGVHSIYKPVHEPHETAVAELAVTLRQMIRQANSSSTRRYMLGQYANTPNLWLGVDPLLPGVNAELLGKLHHDFWKLTAESGEPDWTSRLLVMRALRRAALRRSILILLMDGHGDKHEQSWGELLAGRFFEPFPGQKESMAHRIAVFVEDLAASSGSLRTEEGARHAMLEATRLTDKPVALVGGGGGRKHSERGRLFSGFNSPLYPDILVCTSVGAEGIDLHRHCRRVIHYDLAWNPAVLEQRTGRIDRIGSKTFRERATLDDNGGPFLQVDVPYLAGTYDERMFEELRLRAQTFEVLTGGEFAADHAEGDDLDLESQGKEARLTLVPLPIEMINDLRVNMQVYEPQSDAKPEA